jgi:hypothetical protein
MYLTDDLGDLMILWKIAQNVSKPIFCQKIRRTFSLKILASSTLNCFFENDRKSPANWASYIFPLKKLRFYFWHKTAWATFSPFFSQTHLVPLPAKPGVKNCSFVNIFFQENANYVGDSKTQQLIHRNNHSKGLQKNSLIFLSKIGRKKNY